MDGETTFQRASRDHAPAGIDHAVGAAVRPFIPHARDDAAWSGPSPASCPDYGTLYARETAQPGVLSLWHDKAMQRQFACHVDAGGLGAEIVLHGRRWDVVVPAAQAIVRDMLKASVGEIGQ